MMEPSNMAAIGFTYAQQMLYPVLFQISDVPSSERYNSSTRSHLSEEENRTYNRSKNDQHGRYAGGNFSVLENPYR
jgi:hypothetical protein